MKKSASLIVIFFSFAVIYAQSSQYSQYSQSGGGGGTMLIPRIVYVGDPAVLVLSLPASIINQADIIMTELSPNLPKDANIDFHRIILERRVTGSRLLIEFTAFVPGYLKFPEIEIDGEYFGGLSVTIESVIDTRKSLQLSGYASSLAMPGTAVLLYGFLAIVVLFLLLLFWFIFRGKKFVKIIIEKWKRLRLFTFIRNVVRRLQKALMRGGDKRDILDKISDTFREFLSVLTNANCRSMTAREFTGMPEEIIHNSDFLGYFFRLCDKFRFSGEDVNLREISGLLVDLRNYIEVLYLQEKGVKKNV